nr:ribokinase [Chloroflexota bacterium]
MVARVAVVGSINLDLVVGTAALPQPGETVIGGELQRFGGGKGANQALAAARMGADVALVGRVGRDDFGDLVLDDLGRGGVDLSGVTRSEAATGVAMITVDREGMNTIVVAPGANGQLGAAEIETARVRIESSQVLLLQLEVPMEATLRAAQLGRAAGVTLFLNPSPAQPLPDELLRGLDYLVLNERELHV